MPTASSASRPSRSTAVGVPQVQPSADRPTTWSAPVERPRLVEQVLERHAEPARVADQVAADLVGDAGSVTYRSTIGRCEQVVEGERDRVAHHAVDAQLPRRPGRPAARPARCRCGRSRRSASRTARAADSSRSAPAGTDGRRPGGRRQRDRVTGGGDRARGWTAQRPANPPTAAPTSARPAAVRKRRRSAGRRGGSGGAARPRRAPSPATVPPSRAHSAAAPGATGASGGAVVNSRTGP